MAFAQKEDYNWLLSGGSNVLDSLYTLTTLGFNTGQAVLNNTYQQYPRMSSLTNTSISDENGNLVCYTNGVDLFNATHELIENGAAFHSPTSYPTGFLAIQGGILFPFPDHPQKYILTLADEVDFYFNNSYSLGCSPTTYSVIDMAENNGKGKVIEKNIPINYDTLNYGQYLGVGHGNGRDFWMIGLPSYGGNEHYKYLINPKGVELYDVQVVGSIFNPGVGQGAISPDGNNIGYYNWFGIFPGNLNVGIDLFKFDRCSGEMSDPVQIIYPGLSAPGGIAFSPNSRFVYTPSWDKIYQFDLWATDIPASRITVAEYDGFLDERGLPTRFFQPKLAPDGKIYITVSNVNSRYMHVIDQPDSLGAACNVLQHQILMPTYHYAYMPNHPVTRLGKMQGSPCDTIVNSSIEELKKQPSFELSPNPASAFVEINIMIPDGKSATWQLFSATGQLEKQVNLQNSGHEKVSLDGLPNGMYFYKLVFESQVSHQGKLIVTNLK